MIWGLFIHREVFVNVKTIVIVDDSSQKLRAADDIVHRVFGEGTELHQLYIRGGRWTQEDIVTKILTRSPDLVILDSCLQDDPSPDDPTGTSPDAIQGLEIGKELACEFKACGHTCLVIANTHGATGWSFELTRRMFARFAGITLGAGNDVELEQVLEQIRDGRTG